VTHCTCKHTFHRPTDTFTSITHDCTIHELHWRSTGKTESARQPCGFTRFPPGGFTYYLVGNVVDTLGIFSAPVYSSSVARKGRLSPVSAFTLLLQEDQPSPSPELPTVRDRMFRSVLPVPTVLNVSAKTTSVNYAEHHITS
jgi:hypothetical protein